MSADNPLNSDCTEWLKSIGLEQYAAVFKENNLTRDTLHELTDEDLKSIGVSALGDRKQLLKAIRELTASTPQAAAAPDATGDVAAQIAPPGFDPSQKSMFTIPSTAPADMGAAGAPMGAAISAAMAAGTGSPVESHKPPKPSLWRRMASKRFLFISIAVHLVFALMATIFVVQTISAKRKLTFQGGPPSPNPSQRALEHKVQMAKKQNTMSAPAQAKRIATTGLAKVSLPDMPVISNSTDFTPGKMSGMGGTGVGFGMGGGMGGGRGGGGGIPFFGLRSAGSGLVGTFYDLKQNKDRHPSGMDAKKYTSTVYEFVRSGFHEGLFKHYYCAPATLYAPMIMMPEIPADEGPKAYGVENEVKPGLWVALYQGRVTPPESGKFYFVGAGDDLLFVRFNGRVVLDRCWEPQVQGHPPACKSTKNYHYGWMGFNGVEIPNGFARGEMFSVTAGQSYNIEILIGEQPGGLFSAALLLEKDGADYQRDEKGNPILPVFRVDNKPPPPSDKQHSTAPHMMDGPVWQLKSAPAGLGGMGSF